MSQKRDPIDVFVSVRPDGSAKYYRLTPSGAWTQTMSEKNPALLGLSGEELALIAAGVGIAGILGYFIWKASQSSLTNTDIIT
jgi:hypothetical protein